MDIRKVNKIIALDKEIYEEKGALRRLYLTKQRELLFKQLVDERMRKVK